ncbi:MAG: tetratricopeptide repeat protein [Chitinophagales bacterium]
MKNFCLFVVLFSTSSFIFAQSAADKEKARELGMEAIKIMDEGQIEKSIEMLEKCLELDPENSAYLYEIGYAHAIQKDYKGAIKIGKQLIKAKDRVGQYFQFLGNNYDYNGQPKKAIETYEEGLKIFPKSGMLHVEMGMMQLLQNDYDAALTYWERGIAVDPSYAPNYYRTAQIYAKTPERLWAVMYGELFRNLEPISDRSFSFSEDLFNAYDESINITSDTSMSVSFVQKINMTVESLMGSVENMKLPFPLTYGAIMSVSVGLPSLTDSIESDTTGLTIKKLNQYRTSFINNWYEKEHHKDYTNILFTWHKKLMDEGYFEPYNYWLFAMGAPEEFKTYFEANEAAFDEFFKWFDENAIVISEDYMFHRVQYE